ncbi:MAG: hypothetical protein BWY65_02307 [Firmicutes bacterium ADurb.Bin373]|nr:MAG: hypothetical protein BWY65_02307 [Firmicutes bacterium ADurb.Bin373]
MFSFAYLCNFRGGVNIQGKVLEVEVRLYALEVVDDKNTLCRSGMSQVAAPVHIAYGVNTLYRGFEGVASGYKSFVVESQTHIRNRYYGFARAAVNKSIAGYLLPVYLELPVGVGPASFREEYGNF